MGRAVNCAVLLLTKLLSVPATAAAGQAVRRFRSDIPLAIKIASTPPNSTRTLSPSPTRRQQTPWYHPSWRSAACQFQSAL